MDRRDYNHDLAVAHQALVRLKKGDDEQWSEVEGIAKGALAGDEKSRFLMGMLIHGLAHGVPCCESCADGGECES